VQILVLCANNSEFIKIFAVVEDALYSFMWIAAVFLYNCYVLVPCSVCEGLISLTVAVFV